MSEQKFNEEAYAKTLGDAMDTLMKGGTMRDLKGVSDGEMETLYSIAYNYYTTGKYEEADTIFRYLVYLDHSNAKMWIGLGAVQQVRREFAMAVKSYAMASFLDLSNPKPQYYAAECYLALGDTVNAESALAALDMYAKPNDPFRVKANKLAERIAQMKSAKTA